MPYTDTSNSVTKSWMRLRFKGHDSPTCAGTRPAADTCHVVSRATECVINKEGIFRESTLILFFTINISLLNLEGIVFC